MSWSDQPKEVKDKRVLCSFYLDGPGIVEVRAEEHAEGKRERRYYVSVGGLFGSQTLACEGSDKVFELIDKLSKVTRGRRKAEVVPEGWELLENTEKGEGEEKG